ncbi:hypothetical protein SARC_10099 [Sphaeroforma arctica JP610]|uniref:Uncharacterized protein n=1 Tax=Sphaeroforma arctica JP610 TaxID=667725 RepID=A0A0L0FKX6_9EUKA|nr:hypothetical protein SARC_10099 [Sphaeroforma arctica JP610]KNC77439.1 hypothetical protein SARC_10099 [Sphaeroforma arctica JP610]|eukprot:XP_014151341.1 hypothetical protein SARC_10099 [Sphaeroforma arctica JP610]
MTMPNGFKSLVRALSYGKVSRSERENDANITIPLNDEEGSNKLKQRKRYAIRKTTSSGILPLGTPVINSSSGSKAGRYHIVSELPVVATGTQNKSETETGVIPNDGEYVADINKWAMHSSKRANEDLEQSVFQGSVPATTSILRRKSFDVVDHKDDTFTGPVWTTFKVPLSSPAPMASPISERVRSEETKSLHIVKPGTDLRGPDQKLFISKHADSRQQHYVSSHAKEQERSRSPSGLMRQTSMDRPVDKYMQTIEMSSSYINSSLSWHGIPNDRLKYNFYTPPVNNPGKYTHTSAQQPIRKQSQILLSQTALVHSKSPAARVRSLPQANHPHKSERAKYQRLPQVSEPYGVEFEGAPQPAERAVYYDRVYESRPPDAKQYRRRAYTA